MTTLSRARNPHRAQARRAGRGTNGAGPTEFLKGVGKALPPWIAIGRMMKSRAQSFTGTFMLVLAASATARSAVVTTGNVTPSMPWGLYTSARIGSTTSGALALDGGSELTNRTGVLGYSFGAAGAATVVGTDSLWTNIESLTVGREGEGVLRVEAGGEVSSAAGYIGYSTGSTGYAVIAGEGSQWSNADLLTVGEKAHGTLRVEMGGQVSSSSTSIGKGVSSAGDVTITGTGSKLTNTRNLSVGYSGNASLTVEAGGQVSNRHGYIGWYAGSTGAATISGAGSQWNNSATLHVGDQGRGSLTVENGGWVSTGTLYASVADLHGDGMITATEGAVLDGDLRFDSVHGTQAIVDFGTGGTLTVTANGGYLGAGHNGHGTLTVADGVSIASVGGILGRNAGAMGNASVIGVGTRWSISDGLHVGSIGSASLRVEAGGEVTCSTVYIGKTPGSMGGATITGVGSRLASPQGLRVGDGGSGTLRVESGGLVSNTGSISSYIGRSAGSTGEVAITGAGSQWTNSDDLIIGEDGTGSLRVESGGHVTSVIGVLGKNRWSSGRATITGPDSQWTSTAISLGGDGSGLLRVEDGGRVESSSGWIGPYPGSPGEATVIVTGAGSEWTVDNSLRVAPYGVGSLTVEQGGQVAAGTLYASLANLHGDGSIVATAGAVVDADLRFDSALGTQAVVGFGSGGTLAVTAAGGDLGVVDGGALIVVDGVEIASARGYLGGSGGTASSAIITGVGSRWTNSSHLSVDSASLRVAAGGVVSNASCSIGGSSSSLGSEVTVTGVGSHWTNDTDLNVGYYGGGILNITEGGLVTVGGKLYIDRLNPVGDAFLNMATGGMLALMGEADDSLAQFYNLVLGADALRFWDAAAGAMAPLTDATYGDDYTLEYLTAGDLAGYTLLTVTAVGPPGDYNGDFAVDGDDFLGWQRGESTDPYSATDLAAWQADFGWNTGPVNSVSTAPEPTAWALAVVACLVLGIRRGLRWPVGLTHTPRYLAILAAAFTLSTIAHPALAAITFAGDADPADPTTWTSSTDFFVGRTADGTLTVDGASTATSRLGFIGYEAGSDGIAMVKDAHSVWNNRSVTVGYRGRGTLAISGGGAVESALAGHIGSSVGSLGAVTVDGTGSIWTCSGLYVASSGSGSLVITGGGAMISSNSVFIGTNVGSTGRVSVEGVGSTWKSSGAFSFFAVGDEGSGTLSITAGGAVNRVGESEIGRESGSTGSATVHGAGSTWTTGGILRIGNQGNGSLTVANSGAVTNTDGYLGYANDSTGTVTVDGAGSTWSNSSSLYVGYQGSGSLSITSNGVVSVGENTWVAYDSTSTGTIHFENGTLSTGGLIGAASSLTGTGIVNAHGLTTDVDLVFDANHGLNQTIVLRESPGQDISLNLHIDGTAALGVGYSTAGTMTIADGIVVQSTDGYCGYESGSTGTVAVDGAGSAWSNSGALQIGSKGSGTLAITGGAAVSDSDGFIGNLSGSTGIVTVDGAGSTWTHSDRLNVGRYGNGTLTIINGATVSGSGTGYIGGFKGATGDVKVDGAGSTWAYDSIFVGEQGSGSLAITGGGVSRNSGAGFVGTSIRSTGHVTVDGDGSNWTNSSALYIGYEGSGTLAVTGGGSVSNWHGHIGAHRGSIGTVTVDGAASTWTSSGTLFIGSLGTGTVAITGGADVNSAAVSIGGGSGSTGDVTVDGAGSTWSSGNLVVGDQGRGTLAVIGGGVVGNDDGYIGNLNRSAGAVTVDGPHSTWTNHGSLWVGREGSGTLVITDYGFVSVGGMLAIDANGDADSFINMSTGGVLAIAGDADDSLVQFLDHIEGSDAVRYWDDDLAEWALLNSGTNGRDYTIRYFDEGDLAGFTLLTVGRIGDFDVDDDVDGSDFLIWQRGGSPHPVSQYELIDWQVNFGTRTPPGPSSATVPEPTGMLLIAVGTTCAASGRRRRQSG
ncbi:MAG: hypothetical protein CMJ58_00465 [Planctomycetaceae bacterium]|nr:hypothetical protein [Planctomycetaceae bacterium]